MYDKKIMNWVEVNTAATNIELIELSLGHKIPAGMVDTTELGDHILNAVEVAKIATNIEMIERARNTPPNILSAAWACLGLGALVLYLVVGAIYLLFT